MTSEIGIYMDLAGKYAEALREVEQELAAEYINFGMRPELLAVLRRVQAVLGVTNEDSAPEGQR